MEAELTRDARKWYLEQARAQHWSKTILLEKLASAAHLKKPLDVAKDVCYTNKENINDAKRSIPIRNNRCIRVHLFRSNRFYCIALQIIRQVSRRLLYARC